MLHTLARDIFELTGNRIMKIALIGLGGVGGYFGYQLLAAYKGNPNIQIDFIARGQHGAAIAEHGLQLFSNNIKLNALKPNRVLPRLPAEKYDLILICVKSYGLAQVLEDMPVDFLEGSVVIPLMNGLDHDAVIKKQLTRSVVLPSCVYVASHLKAAGVIEHNGSMGRIICGVDKSCNYDYSEITDIFSRVDIGFDLVDDASLHIWKKFLFVASFGLVTARFNVTFGEVLSSPVYLERVTAISNEILKVAIAKGLNLDSSEATRILETARQFPSNTRSSLQLDVHTGRGERTELDQFTIPVIRYGQEVGVDTFEIGLIRSEILSLRG